MVEGQFLAVEPSGKAQLTEANDDYDLERMAAWVTSHGFLRVALQFPDEHLADSPRIAAALRGRLPHAARVFVLGDSTHGSSSVDEVAADHYGADCIVHVGPSDQQHDGTLPVLYVFVRAPLTATAISSQVAAELRGFSADDIPTSLALVCDVALQHAACHVASALAIALENVANSGGDVYLAVPRTEDTPEMATRERRSRIRRRDWRFGALLTSSWWAATLGPLALAAVAKHEPLLLCGRVVHRLDNNYHLCPEAFLGGLPALCGLVLLATSRGTALERRLLLRYGATRPVWRLDPDTGSLERLSCQSLLLQRYRFVELAKSAAVIGLLLAASGTKHAQAVADRLEAILHRAGRKTYRFSIGRVTPEKLGNFPEIELFVSLASPEHFPWESREFIVPIASPYEVEVGLGARLWTGEYITDPAELLRADPPPTETHGLVDDDAVLAVQTLGDRARVKHFTSGRGLRASAAAGMREFPSETPPPAVVTQGLDGVAKGYTSEMRAS